MSVLSSKARKDLSKKEFAGPNRSYPIPDATHARAALSLGARYASPAELAKIKAKVHAKFPNIGNTRGKSAKNKTPKEMYNK